MSKNDDVIRINLLLKATGCPELHQDLAQSVDRGERLRTLATIGLMVCQGHASMVAGAAALPSDQPDHDQGGVRTRVQPQGSDFVALPDENSSDLDELVA